MADTLTPDKRHWVMSRVRGKDTKPELIVRSIVHRMGYRFRLYCRDLAGSPDLVLRRHKKVIFVHGCFWHQHGGCRRANRPSSNTMFWNVKLDGNIARDKQVRRALKSAGWDVLIVWECETQDTLKLQKKLARFLHADK